ncbi:hypothetical protein T02_4268 [Trichinella nativa]|uniref:Uncharacterized protein n=1 Tax=Trichinella nativa TaxID=6335 RepID=A0A0V1LMK4_9BILA|nr:hypothetical protein T02_4268 [Trichinella nativa]
MKFVLVLSRVARDSVVVANFSWHQGVSNVASQTSDALSQTKRYSVAVLPPCSRYLGNKCKLGKILFVSISGHCGAAECFSVTSKMAAIKQRLTSGFYECLCTICHQVYLPSLPVWIAASSILCNSKVRWIDEWMEFAFFCVSSLHGWSYHSGCIICRNAPDDSPPDLPENYGDHLPSAARCGIVDVAGQSMQGCIRNSGSFSACTQPAESSGAGVVRNKSRILAAGLLLCVPISSTSFPSVNSKVIEDSSDPEGVAGIPLKPFKAISAKSERLTMRLEDAHGRMEPYAVMELMTAVFNSPDAIPLNR